MKNLPLRTIDTEKVGIIREWARHSSEKAGLNLVALYSNENGPKTGD